MKGFLKSLKKGGDHATQQTPPEKTDDHQAADGEPSSPSSSASGTPDKKKKIKNPLKKLFNRVHGSHHPPGYVSPYGTESFDAAGDLHILKDPQLLYKSNLELHLHGKNQFIILFDLHDLMLDTKYTTLHGLDVTRVSRTEVRAQAPGIDEIILLPSVRTSKKFTKPPSDLTDRPATSRKVSSPAVFSTSSPASDLQTPETITEEENSSPQSPPQLPPQTQPRQPSQRKFSEPALSMPFNTEKTPPTPPSKPVASGGNALTGKDRSVSATQQKSPAASNTKPSEAAKKAVDDMEQKPATHSTSIQDDFKPPQKPEKPSIPTSTSTRVVAKEEPQETQSTPPPSVTPKQAKEMNGHSRKPSITPSAPLRKDSPPKQQATIQVAVPVVKQEQSAAAQQDEVTTPEIEDGARVVVEGAGVSVKIEEEEENLLEKVKDVSQLDVLTRGRPRANTRRLPTKKGLESHRVQQDEEMPIPERDSFTVSKTSEPPRGPGMGVPMGGFQLPPPVARPSKDDGTESSSAQARSTATRMSYAGPMPSFNPAEAKLRKADAGSRTEKADAQDSKQMDFRDVLRKKKAESGNA
eukprot:TRINITY_DN2022_c0_g1_i1.p1 TRINITY_DN2022_c0_g1~~TRINITY_DN2022_c0_g1_i1.p1  ORF type:complete len:580 (-),score=161.43 TRINITY_DN2022_c0_g1_i1:312-2051(-)